MSLRTSRCRNASPSSGHVRPTSSRGGSAASSHSREQRPVASSGSRSAATSSQPLIHSRSSAIRGSPSGGGVAALDVDDVKAEADRLRGEAVEIGVVVELHGQIRLLDVYDPDGNRIQLTQELAPSSA